MKTLKLTLKKEWFDLINSGEKPEEYREIKEYWSNRLIESDFAWDSKTPDDIKCHLDACPNGVFKKYDFVEFRNGYSKTSPTMLCEFKGIEIKNGNPKWGAIENETYFVIKLGFITERYNC